MGNNSSQLTSPSCDPGCCTLGDSRSERAPQTWDLAHVRTPSAVTNQKASEANAGSVKGIYTPATPTRLRVISKSPPVSLPVTPVPQTVGGHIDVRQSVLPSASRLNHLADVLTHDSKRTTPERKLALCGERETGHSEIDHSAGSQGMRERLGELQNIRQQRLSQQVQENVMRSVELAAERAATAHGSLDRQRAMWQAAAAARRTGQHGPSSALSVS
jgi:hypothetical protein